MHNNLMIIIIDSANITVVCHLIMKESNKI